MGENLLVGGTVMANSGNFVNSGIYGELYTSNVGIFTIIGSRGRDVSGVGGLDNVRVICYRLSRVRALTSVVSSESVSIFCRFT